MASTRALDGGQIRLTSDCFGLAKFAVTQIRPDVSAVCDASTRLAARRLHGIQTATRPCNSYSSCVVCLPATGGSCAYVGVAGVAFLQSAADCVRRSALSRVPARTRAYLYSVSSGYAAAFVHTAVGPCTACGCVWARNPRSAAAGQPPTRWQPAREPVSQAAAAVLHAGCVCPPPYTRRHSVTNSIVGAASARVTPRLRHF